MSDRLLHFVLDSFALLAYLENEAGAELVGEILADAQQEECRVLFSLINYGECLYIVERERGLPAAQMLIGLIDQLPLVVVEPDRTHVFAAAHLKAHYPISYADAFAVALAQQSQATLLTGDPEFAKVQHLVTVHWLPQN